MILAYLTDINESRFRYGDFSDREKKIIEQAVVLLKEYEDNFYIVRMPNPTIELVKHIIRENCLTKDISYVFYDYIFIGPSLLNEFKFLRTKKILLPILPQSCFCYRRFCCCARGYYCLIFSHVAP